MGIEYPKTREIPSWQEFASQAKTVLLLHGTKHQHYDWFYEDDFISIRFMRQRGLSGASYFEVSRKEMLNHPAGTHLHVENPFYMESGGERIRVHGEVIYVYDHIMFLCLGGRP